MTQMKTLLLPSGRSVPILGQGTWEMGDDPSKRSQEIAALRKGLDLGMSLIDTAEMYGNGESEKLIAEAIGDRRDEIFLVSKVLPQNASQSGTIEACERSLKRLKTDRLDLYLLHWRGEIPLHETLEAFQYLKQQGKILDYGVSNFDVTDMEEAVDLASNEIATNQVLYNLMARGIEKGLLPWCHERNIPIMAYSPFGHSREFLNHPLLLMIAIAHDVKPAQVALAWIFRQKGVLAIPKASTPEHVLENFKSLELKLSNDELRALDEAFPPPAKKMPLEVL